MVRSDLTNLQQYRLTERVISARKLKEIRTIGEGRGRKLKSTEFPELPTVLLYAFGEHDIKEDGGGVESHPRLTTGTLYRAVDNVTTMKSARDILLSLAPSGFHISLSSCYNYTENFRRGSRQAVQHHADRGVNAPLSLRKPPRTGVQQLVVNLHWTTANVNHIVDSCQDLAQCLIVSKDAKAVIPTDISAVQYPGPTWKKRLELPDHTWDQSRTNAITPMTFLFLQSNVTMLPASTVESLQIGASDTTHLQLTRTGQGITLLNLSFYEPETTFKCLNELCYLLTLPALDVFFRDRNTGRLKKELTFVVDNGPAEQPCSPLVQMCLVRLLNFLRLNKVTQVSFAEYHSKRNFVERVHAEENRVLSKHGPFRSHPIHDTATPGSKEHRENMEAVAENVRECVSQGSFGGRPLLCYRGVKPCDHVFTDERDLQNFLSLSEEEKLLFSPSTYCTQKGTILDSLHMVWNVDREFTGHYVSDHQTLHNTLLEDTKTCWADKYTTAIYSASVDNDCKRYELQPIPDYLRWFRTGELHYLPLEERALLSGIWDEIPAAFLPAKILELCFIVVQHPTDDMIQQISLLSWVPPREVKDYQKKLQDQLDNQKIMEKEKNRWKSHELYRKNPKVQLEALCRKSKIPVTSSLAKHQLVSLITSKRGEEPPSQSPVNSEYNGNRSSIPTTTTAISRLTVAYLKSILAYHHLPVLGSKEQLVLRVYLLRHNEIAAVAAREERQLKDLIDLANKIIFEHRRLSFSSHVYRRRKYSLQASYSSFVPIPDHIKVVEDLPHLFHPLLSLMDRTHKENKERGQSVHVLLPRKEELTECTEEELLERITQTGAKVKVKWLADELKDSDWKEGWYSATVNGYCDETDLLTVTYTSEPGTPYEEELLPLIANKKLKLVWSPL